MKTQQLLSVFVICLCQLARAEILSTIKKLGEGRYLFHNVCLLPRGAGGIHFYVNSSKDNLTVVLCNELPNCFTWPLSVVSTASSPLVSRGSQASSRIWFSAENVTGLLEPFTDLTGWHLFHHFIPLRQLLIEEMHKFQTPEIHLHSTFVSNFYRKRFPSKHKTFRTSFNKATSPFWPLLLAVPPPILKLTQVNFIEFLKLRGGAIWGVEDPKTLVDGDLQIDSNLKVLSFKYSTSLCYETFYLGTSRMMTHDGLKNGTWWQNIKEDTIEGFRQQVFKLSNASNIISSFCGAVRNQPIENIYEISKDGVVSWKVPPPNLVFIMRNTSRRIMNLPEVQAVLDKLNFNITEIYWENFDVWGQVRIARSADIVFGAHGNGMANVFWMRRGSAVVEVYPGTFKAINEKWDANDKSNYGSLAAFAGAHHMMFKRWSAEERPIHAWRLSNVVVPIPKFTEVMYDVVQLMGKACQ